MSTITTFPNPLRELGKTGIKLPAIGFGTMGLSGVYGASDDNKSRALLRDLVQLGCVFWDTADGYGKGHNEELIAPVLQGFRDKVFICSKFGFDLRENAPRLIRGDRQFVLDACEASLKRLGVDCIDLYYQHRVDPETPVEETMSALKELQDAGKIKNIGIFECSAETLKRVLKVVRVEAVEVEYSPWEIGPETSGLLDVMRENGVSLIAYAALGRGMLTGQIKSPDDLSEDDFRRTDPRFQGEAFNLNMRLVDRIGELAEAKSKALGIPVMPAAFCLAWVLYQGEDFFVIPGTRSLDRMKENLTAARVLPAFTKEDDEAVRKVIKEINVIGDRYNEVIMKTLGK
ncbi:hypothetical protein FRB99_002844 [Tulasnella sp. 403]|nr:hypothetical protein FRB99_002844 [Tulasnella sp. 403]